MSKYVDRRVDRNIDSIVECKYVDRWVETEIDR